MFWGQEAGPQSMGDSSAAVFNRISDVLAKEAELISTFEAEINAALKDFTGTRQQARNSQRFREVLARVTSPDAAAAAKVAHYEFDKHSQIEAAVRSFPGSAGQSSITGAAGTLPQVQLFQLPAVQHPPPHPVHASTDRFRREKGLTMVSPYVRTPQGLLMEAAHPIG